MLQNELNRNPFTVPENYFDRLPTLVQERCADSERISKPGLWGIIKPRIAYVAGTAAVALLAYGGFLFTGNNSEIDKSGLANTKVKPVSANSFLNNNAKSYAQFASPFQFASDKNTGVHNEMDEDIVNYLAVENISVDDLLELE